jgi:STE24 endopeptidase
MRIRDILVGAAAGAGAGYALARAVQSASCVRGPAGARARDAAEYGALRRSLTVAGIVRGIASSAALAYGPLGELLARNASRAPLWLRPALFAGEALLVDAIVEFPVEFFEGHAIERTYGLSEQSDASWLGDRLKETAISACVAALLATAFGAVLRKFPRSWPALASAGVFPLLLIGNIVVPIYVMPLFNTYEPLRGPLEERLRRLAARYGVGDAEILRVNMSKQTKKANAFVTGIGNTHRIVVGDTLTEHFPEDEIEFVVAHEIGHYVSKDTWRMIAVGQVCATLLLFAAYYTVAPAQRAVPSDDARHIARIQFWATLFSQAMRPALSAFARSREWAADRFAVDALHAPATGASAFRRLRDQNLAQDEQPAWFEFWFSTHPSLKQRIAALERP